jgi:hypothetical protein
VVGVTYCSPVQQGSHDGHLRAQEGQRRSLIFSKRESSMSKHKNDMIEVGLLDEMRNYRKKFVAHALVEPDIRARMAMDLVAKWGLVAAIPDGEDSYGRSKLRLSTPEEMVDRAVETVDLLMIAFKQNGWMVDCPSLDDLNATPINDK